MAIAATQSDFRAHMKTYLNEIDNNGETVYIARPRDTSVAVISQEKLIWMERYIQAAAGSAEKGIAEDKLTELGIIPAQPIVDESNWNEFWDQFKK